MGNPILEQDEHRPWPLPPEPWIMAQSWHDLLFAHWPVPVETMRNLVPPELELDTFEGEAWVGVVPFRMSRIRPMFLPPLPWLSAFLELNVRTYVKSRDPDNPKPGVYFFSLDAANPVAVAVARATYKLPYFRAEMSLQVEDEVYSYRSERTHRGAAGADFAGKYGPTGNPALAQTGTIDHWLTERYCLYTVSGGQVYRGEIHHQPWPLQPAFFEADKNNMAEASKIDLPDIAPLLHFAKRIDVVVWPIRKVAG